MEFAMPNEKEANWTLIRVNDMIENIHKGWNVYFNSCPSKEILCIILSYWAITTDWGSKIYNYNVGNILSLDGDGYDYIYKPNSLQMEIKSAELLKALDPSTVNITYKDKDKALVWTLPNHRLSRFRAYENVQEGVIDYLCHLARMLGDGWSAVQRADMDALGGHFVACGLASEPLRTSTGNGFMDVLEKYMKVFKEIDFDYDKLSLLSEDEKQRIKNNISLSLLGE